jgi:hypothetical protein
MWLAHGRENARAMVSEGIALREVILCEDDMPCKEVSVHARSNEGVG